MPAGYTHYVYGQKVLKSLDEKYKKIVNDHIDLFNIGIHGPDILFYYNAYKSNPVAKQGSRMHLESGMKFFAHAKEVIEKADDKEAALAYTYGFICHYMLDHACHPTIFQLQDDLDMSHTEIESEFDRKLLVLEGKNPLTSNLTVHIHPSIEVSKVIAPFFDLDEKTIYKSLNDLLFFLGWIRCPGKIKRGFVHTFMKIGGIYDELSGLIINYQEKEKSKESIKNLIELMDSAVVEAKNAIESFDQPLDERYYYNFETNELMK